MRRITTNIFNSGMRFLRRHLHSFINLRLPLKALRSYEHTCKEKLQNVSRVLNETRNTDTSSKGTSYSLSETLKEQTTKAECKRISVKEEKIVDNVDISTQDNVESPIPNQAFSGTL